MLIKPRRIPSRFNRRVHASTRRLVERKFQRKRSHWEYGQRKLQRIVHQVARWRMAYGYWILLGLAAGGTGAGMLLLSSPLFTVRELIVQRTSPRVDIEEVQQALAPLFGKRLFLVSTDDVEALLKENIPDLEDLEVTKQYPARLQVKIMLEPVVARLNIRDPGTSAEPEDATGALLRDYLTAKGTYISTIAAEEGQDLPVIHLVDWGVRPVPGTRLLVPSFLEQMWKAEQTLMREFGYEIIRRTVFLRAREFHVQTGGLTLWFDSSPLDEQLRRYRMFLKAGGPGEAKEYVDLRLSDRIVYK